MPVSRARSQNQPVSTELVPYWRSDCGRATIYVGDCREVMAKMDWDQFHAVVTDPPYGLEFMGARWDAPWKNDGGFNSNQQEDTTGRGSWIFGGTPSSHNRPVYGHNSEVYQEWFRQRAEQILRVAKPGAHLLSFGGTRMWHRMACAIEDAGFEVRDTIMWVYGQGFPKSQDVSKAIDRELGAKRDRVACIPKHSWREMEGRDDRQYDIPSDEPVTDQAKRWYGWGTSLKPSVEPVIVARRPFRGTTAQCVMENGTGAMNIDGCRVGNTGGTASVGEPNHLNQVYGSGMGGLGIIDAGKGRWPANLIHDGSDEVLALFPESKSSSAAMPLPKKPGDCIGRSHDREDTEEYWKQGGGGFSTVGRSTVRGHDDEGNCARFFYTAKADDSDRPHGKGKHVTTHPTVKPLDLMRYLVRLVCVRGGTVLDPFMGSGSTGCAAVLEGMRFVGIELSEEYADLAIGKIKLALAQAGPCSEPVPTSHTATATTPAPKKLRGTQ